MKNYLQSVLSALTIALVIGLFKTSIGFSVDLETAKLEIAFLKEQILSMRGDLSEIKTDIKEIMRGSNRGR